MTNKTIHTNIISQLGGMGKMEAMVNAKYVSYDAEGTTRFYISGNRKMNHVTIRLNENDLYDVTFSKHTAGKFNPKTFVITEDKWKQVESLNDVFAEDLKASFERVTGLYLSL